MQERGVWIYSFLMTFRLKKTASMVREPNSRPAEHRTLAKRSRVAIKSYRGNDL